MTAADNAALPSLSQCFIGVLLFPSAVMGLRSVVAPLLATTTLEPSHNPNDATSIDMMLVLMKMPRLLSSAVFPSLLLSVTNAFIHSK
jgi:hypothetical protein